MNAKQRRTLRRKRERSPRYIQTGRILFMDGFETGPSVRVSVGTGWAFIEKTLENNPETGEAWTTESLLSTPMRSIE